jgi:LysM repeat protein
MENEFINEAADEIYIEQDLILEAADTLESLAEDYGTSVEEILEVNPEIDQRNVLPTQLRIPVRIRSCPGGTLYTVRRGDTLFRLAREFNVSANRIQQANPNINFRFLRPGTVLCIPGRRGGGVGPSGVRIYTIQGGDSLYSIARRFNTSVATILQLNPGLNPDRLYVGQRIRVPA